MFLLDFCSECFVWVGKKVQDKDRLLILHLAYQTLCLLHAQGTEHIEKMGVSIVESGCEPELFKEAFRDGWQNYEHTESMGIKEYSDEDEDEKRSSEKKNTIVVKSNVDIIPESFWIN